ncbi:hypothetical protein CFP71_30070 [Amycolatopsis thailandensis]|uniref:Uncharacterized protein n=1 Tax=Amycolatopsis thailandensis TaxID=589330 RepID=A0A229RRP8_9PSEU|nr:hypothetical protein [Amycolatopsis thailandensis]OXM49352.1 hypothetical protein CFP71_30070 [Amycolatopsis thailandensis]
MTPLSLDFPVLLGPVRVETRFTPTHLLIRVFPDEWSVNKFEPRPTQAEVSALDAYWTAMWASGGQPVGEQAAWHQLVARIPAGRAGWLVRSREPGNPTERPLGVPIGTTVLVVVSPQPVPAADRTPTTTYWTAVWKAHGDRGKLRDAEIALLAAVGANRAAAIRGRRPSGVDSAPNTPGDNVVVAFLVLPTLPADKIAPQSWTVAAKAALLPDKFTFFGYVGDRRVFAEPGLPVRQDLAVSPDPKEPPATQLRINERDGTLFVPPALEWLTEFDKAVGVGMGIRIKRTADFPGGLDRLVVLGLREQATPEDSAAAFGKLLEDQLHSPAGFAFLPQGTPTNNSEELPAGQDRKTEAEAGLATIAGFTAAAPDWRTKTDGEWFAELLGLDPAKLAGVPNAKGTDRRDARAAHTALWPATWGNYLPALLNGVLTGEQIAQTREFFLANVSGRGPLPTVKIGRQPYGILPTTAFSKLAWPATTPHRTALNAVLATATADWRTALKHVSSLDKPGADRHQTLLDILALHPTSAEFRFRYAESAEAIAGQAEMDAELDRLTSPLRETLTRLGVSQDTDPDLLRRLFADDAHPLLAPVVDDRPLSETKPIRPYTLDKRDYLTWLATSDLNTIREELGFIDDLPPDAVLYSLARHAVLLGWAETARRLALATPGADVPDVRDAPFVHIGPADRSESRYRTLYSTDPAIAPDRPVHEHIRSIMGSHPATGEQTEQIEAIKILATLPTARLERVFAEHVDCATYRLDAWRLGLVNERLAELRSGPSATRGLHLGAYGWLEHVHPNTEPVKTVNVPADLTDVFGTDPIPQDSHNGGYIHAPSPAHARTAAVLRAGYVANADRGKENVFAVNLSSERVRLALTIADGMRQGQSLSALLGYRFERGLHDRRAGLDALVSGMRLRFPLRANKIEETKPSPDDPAVPTSIEQVEARNVIDGLKLLRRANELRAAHPTTENADDYPFGYDDLKPATGQQILDIRAEIRALRNVQDAVADLSVAEGTHQALLGNTERASAALDAYAKEGLPPAPMIVETPRSGTTLTHRLAVQFTPGLGPDHNAPLLGHNPPRAQAEPAVDDWLPAVLPKPENVVARVSWTEPDGSPDHRDVTQQETGLSSIDLLFALRPADAAAMTDLDDRIIGVVTERAKPRPDRVLSIDYTQRVPNKVSFFELSPLVAAVRTLMTTSRPLRQSDLTPAAGSTTVNRAADDDVTLPRERPAAVLASLTVLVDEDVADFVTDLGALYPKGQQPARAAVLDGIDGFLTRYAKLATASAGFGLPRSGWGELTVWRRGVFADLLEAVAELAARMTTALTAANLLLAQYEDLPGSTPDEDRFTLLEKAERLLTTKAQPRMPTPFQMRSRVRGLRNDFGFKVKALERQASTTRTTLSALLTEVAGNLPPADYDPLGVDLIPFQDQVVAYGQELLSRARKLSDELSARRTVAAAALVRHDQAATGPDRVRAGTDALKALLGEDVLVVPEFTPPAPVMQQWRKARADSDKLIAHLNAKRDFPVDDWLHGMARVRDKPRLWEQTVLLSDALLGPGGLLGTGILGWVEPKLSPIQLPYVTGDHWLGLEFAPGPNPLKEEDRLLFTAHYATSLNNDRQCGLVLDEWTEVIPAERETTGVAVHYDGPDAEPPQAMLLVAPPARVVNGSWSATDLLDAVVETFDLAKIRAVEPAHLGETPLAHLLPATIMSATRQMTVGTDLAQANERWRARR